MLHTLEDPHQLIEALLDAYRRGVWQPDYVLVYQVVVADQALILLSKQAKTQLLLNADADIDPAGKRLAELTANLSVTYQTNELLRFDAQGGMTLFYNAYRVKQGFWTGRLKVRPFAVGEPPNIFERI